MTQNEYKTVNLKPDTKKKLDLLKSVRGYSSLNEVIEEEIDFSDIEKLL